MKNEETLTLEQIVQQDMLEKLLEVKTISFEIRSENQVVLDYLIKPQTLKKLLTKHIFVPTKTNSTDKAIDVFGCADAMRNVFQTILSTPDLISALFEALIQYIPQSDIIAPAELAPPHIYLGFQKILSAMMMSPKRVQLIAVFLQDNPKYIRAWAAHIQSQQMTDVFKTFVIDYKGRGDDTCRVVSQLLLKSSILDALIGFIVTNAPLECVSNSASILSNIISQNVPYLSEVVITKIPAVCNYLMNQPLTGPELLRLHFAADYVVCGLSFMIQKELQNYFLNENNLQKVCYDLLQKRQAFNEQMINGQAKVQLSQQAKFPQQVDFPGIGINEIDTFEKVMIPVFVQILDSLGHINERITYLKQQARTGLFGYGTFVLLQFVARLIAISADLKVVIQKQITQKQNKPQDWTGNEDAIVTIQAEASYASLSLSAHAGCGGPSSVDILQTFKQKSVPMLIAVPNIIRKIMKTGLIAELVDVIEQFEGNSNLHFVVSRIFTPIVEFGDAAPEISMYLFQNTKLMQNMCKKLDQFVPFKSRTSLQTYYITFARSFLRIALKLSDESAVEEKQKFVANKQQTNQQAPQHLSAAMKQALQIQNQNQCVFEYLQQNEAFRIVSQKWLEFEDEIPKTFGDVRLTAEYAASKTPKTKKKQGVFDIGFGNFGGFQQNEFFGFGGNQGWGDLGAKKDEDKGGFGFGWGDFQ